jgi:hypothetical protein
VRDSEGKAEDYGEVFIAASDYLARPVIIPLCQASDQRNERRSL